VAPARLVQGPQALPHELHRICHFYAPVGCQPVATGLVGDQDFQAISPSRYKLARDGEPVNFHLQTFVQMTPAVYYRKLRMSLQLECCGVLGAAFKLIFFSYYAVLVASSGI
jgi:hypothetical protein